MLKVKNKIISLSLLTIMLFQLFIPVIDQCYASSEEYNDVQNNVTSESENNVEDIIDNQTSDKDRELESDNNDIIEVQNDSNVLKDEVQNNAEEDINNFEDNIELENKEDEMENIIIENDAENNNNNEDEIINENESENENENESEIASESEETFEIIEDENIGISLATASGGGTGAGNEDEFRNAFYNGNVSELTISTTFRLNSVYTVNHTLRIDASSQVGANSLQLSSGARIIVPNGCVLTLDEVVIDGRTHGNNDGKSCITVQSGGVLMLTGHSIIDGGTKNWGINVENGGQLLIESGQVSYCDRGIVVQGNSYCDLASNTTVQWWGNTGKSVDITHNNIGIYCGNAYSGTLIVNHTSQSSEKINFENNTWGVFAESHSGNISIINARMVYNGWAIYTYGNMSVSGINGAYNARGIVNERRNN